MATIFAWSGALYKRGQLDENQELMDFAKALEKATLDTMNEGKVTKDLAGLIEGQEPTVLDSWQFIDEIAKHLENSMN